MLGWRNHAALFQMLTKRHHDECTDRDSWTMLVSSIFSACVGDEELFCAACAWMDMDQESRREGRRQSKYSRRWPSTADHWTHHISTVASFACRLPTDTAMGPETSGRALLRTVCTACYCAGFLATVQQCVPRSLPGRFLRVVFLQPSYSRFRFRFHFRSIGWSALSRRSLQPVALAGPFRRTKVSGLSSGFVPVGLPRSVHLKASVGCVHGKAFIWAWIGPNYNWANIAGRAQPHLM
jgi:hypothetical protein